MRRLRCGTMLFGIWLIVQIGPSAGSASAQALEEQAAAQVKLITEQAVVFRVEHLGQPAESLASLVLAGYVDEALLTDPWGQSFEYASARGPQGELTVWSRGPAGTGGFTPGNPGQFAGQAIGFSTVTGPYLQGQ